MRYKHSFGIIVHNGAGFLRECIESVYPVAHEIIVVEGSDRYAAFLADGRGLSVDGTSDLLKSVADPEHKIRYVAAGRVEDKTEQCNHYMRLCTGDWIWELDSDELWREDDFLRLDAILARGDWEAVEVPFLHFWRDIYHVARGTHWETPIRRGLRFRPGDVYSSHRPPEIARKPWKEMRVLGADHLRGEGIYCYHYGFIESVRVKWKGMYHVNRGRADMLDWHWRSFLANTAEHMNNTRKEREGNRIEPFANLAQHPAPISSRERWTRRNRIRVLHVLPSWSMGGGCTAVRELICASNPGLFEHVLLISSQTGFSGLSPLPPGFEFFSDGKQFLEVATSCDVVEFHFWRSMPELTEWTRVVRGLGPGSLGRRPRTVVVIPIYNDNRLRGRFDRFYLSEEEKQIVDHVVFVTEKAIGLLENAGVGDHSYVPWGPDMALPALLGSQRGETSNKSVGFVGPLYPEVTYPGLIDVLSRVRLAGQIDIAGFGKSKLLIAMKERGRIMFRDSVQVNWIAACPYEEHLRRVATWDVFAYPMKQMCYCASEMKIQEACACGCPLVIKPSAGLAEMGLESCGTVCGRYEEVPGAIDVFLADPAARKAAGDRARIHALQRMGAHTAARDMEAIYVSLAEG